MKRFLALFLIVVLNSTMTVSARQVEIPENWEGLPTATSWCRCEDHLNQTALLIPGDLSRDNDVNAVDALYVLQLAVDMLGGGIHDGICYNAQVVDVNQDNKQNAHDALLILQYAVGKVDSFATTVAIPDFTIPDYAL